CSVLASSAEPNNALLPSAGANRGGLALVDPETVIRQGLTQLLLAHPLDEQPPETCLADRAPILRASVAAQREQPRPTVAEPRTQASRDFVAIEPRQPDVHERHIGWLSRDHLQTRGAVGCNADAVPVELQQQLQHVARV